MPDKRRAGCLADVDVVILAGGLGSRLTPVLPDTPKVLAPVGDRVFVDLLLDWLEGFGANRIILALGYRAEAVVAHLAARPRGQLDLVHVIEPRPAGTAGALRCAASELRSTTILVMNGDTLVNADLCAFLVAHRRDGAEATLLCTRVDDAGRFGTVEVDAKGRIVAFREKVPGGGAGLINAGVYLLSRGFLDRLAVGEGSSLERDVFQQLPAGSLAAYAGDFPFLDIGTPDDLPRAGAFIRRLAEARR